MKEISHKKEICTLDNWGHEPERASKGLLPMRGNPQWCCVTLGELHLWVLGYHIYRIRINLKFTLALKVYDLKIIFILSTCSIMWQRLSEISSAQAKVWHNNNEKSFSLGFLSSSFSLVLALDYKILGKSPYLSSLSYSHLSNHPPIFWVDKRK